MAIQHLTLAARPRGTHAHGRRRRGARSPHPKERRRTGKGHTESHPTKESPRESAACGPALPRPNMGKVLVQGAKARKHGVARGTARHVPRNTCCRHQPSLPLHDYNRVPNTPAHTPEHKRTYKATNHVLDRTGTAKAMVPKKRPENAETRGRCVWTRPKPVLGQEGGGGGGARSAVVE